MIVRRSIEIKAATDKIWPHITEPELILKWFTFLTKYEYKDAGRGGEGGWGIIKKETRILTKLIIKACHRTQFHREISANEVDRKKRVSI